MKIKTWKSQLVRAAGPIVHEIGRFKRKFRRKIWIRRGILDRFKGQALEQTFDTIYREGMWGKGSGLGSEGLWADEYIAFVRKFIADKQVRTVTDVGCGDFGVGARIIDLVEAYNATDISSLIIERNKKKFNCPNVKFIHLDACVHALPAADLITIRQVLQHLTNAEIESILTNVEKSGAKFCIVAEHLPSEKEFIGPNIDVPSHGAGIRPFIGSGVLIDQPPFSRAANMAMTIPDPDPASQERLGIFVYAMQ